MAHAPGMSGLTKIGLLLAVSLLSACISGVRVRSAGGGAAALEALPTFTIVEADSNAREEEALFLSGQVKTTDLESHLREQLKTSLMARGYAPAPLENAHFAVSVDANYYAKSQNMELGGTRSFLGTGNRQKSASAQQLELSVALDFIDLRSKKMAWRITAQGPPPTPEDEAVFLQKVLDLVDAVPAIKAR